MKNTKSLKIALLVISAALLLGAAVGITASAAEETSAPVVYSQNVEYGGNYALMYAITAESVTGETVSLAVYNNAECAGDPVWSKTVAATEANQETVKGKACYVFTTNGIAAKNMDVQYYVKVTAANGETVKRYSVAEYLYERLYKNGIASSTEEGNIKRAELYNTILLYGKQAQDVLFNYNTDENGELITTDDRSTFVTDMKYVFVDEAAGTVDGTYVSGIFLNGTEVTFVANDAAGEWDLINLDTGATIDTIASGDSFNVNSHVKVTKHVEIRGSGLYADSAITYDGKAFADISDITHVGYSGMSSTVVDVDGNDALKFTRTSSTYERYSIARKGTSDNFVFETDVMIPEYNSALDFYIMPTSNLSAAAAVYRGYIYFKYDANTGKNYITLTTAGSNADSTDPETWYYLTPGEWANVRVEYDGTAKDDLFRLIVNGQLVYEVPLHNSMAGFAGFQMQFASTYSGTIYFDNTYLGDKK